MLESLLDNLEKAIDKIESENTELYTKMGLRRNHERAKDHVIFSLGLLIFVLAFVVFAFDSVLIGWYLLLLSFFMLVYGIGLGEEIRIIRYRRICNKKVN